MACSGEYATVQRSFMALDGSPFAFFVASSKLDVPVLAAIDIPFIFAPPSK